MAHVLSNLFWTYGIKFTLSVVTFILGWISVHSHRRRKKRRENDAQAWPYVEGVIVEAKVRPVSETKYFYAVIQYAFLVDEYRVGKYVQEFENEDAADDFVRQLRDKRVRIRYKQSDPDDSVLEQSVVEQQVMLAPRFG